MRKLSLWILAFSVLISFGENADVIRLNNTALELMNNGQVYDAIDSLMKAHPIDKNHIETYYNLGLAYQQIFHYEKALENYAYALRAFPERKELHWNLAHIYNAIGQYDKAVSEIAKYIELDPPLQKLDHAQALLDSFEYRDSSKSMVILMEKSDVVKHNEDDLIYYAFRFGGFYSDSNDTVLIFARGEDIEKVLIVGSVYNGKRKIRATLPKKALVEYWLRGSRSHSLLGYYVKPGGTFYMRIQLEETRRIKNPISGDLVERKTYKFYDVDVDTEGAYWYLIEDGVKQEPECFLYKNRGN